MLPLSFIFSVTYTNLKKDEIKCREVLTENFFFALVVIARNILQESALPVIGAATNAPSIEKSCIDFNTTCTSNSNYGSEIFVISSSLLRGIPIVRRNWVLLMIDFEIWRREKRSRTLSDSDSYNCLLQMVLESQYFSKDFGRQLFFKKCVRLFSCHE